MMFNSQPRSFDLDALETARRRRLHRAGLRTAPREDGPSGAFVAIEMAVLVFVSALAMVSVIVTTGCSPAEAHALEVRSDAAGPHRPAASATNGAQSSHEPDRLVASRSARP